MSIHLLQATVVPYAIFALTIAAQIGLMSTQLQNGPGYLGCFRDYNSDRALPAIGPIEERNDQSVEWCFENCWDTLSSNYTYAGVEYKDECFCWNNEDYGRHGKKPESECQDECQGNRNQICGDWKRISIYRISEGVCSNDIGPPTDGSHRITNPHFLSFNLNNFKFFGTRVDFYCHDGYTLNGASSIQCIDTGYNNVTWNDTVPTCEVEEWTTISMTTTMTPSPTTWPERSPTAEATTETSESYTREGTEPLSYGTEFTWGRNTTWESTGESTAGTSQRITEETSLITYMPTKNPTSGRLATGTIVGIAGGIAAVVGILLLLALIFLYRKRRPKKNQSSDVPMATISGSYHPNEFTNQLSSDVISQPPLYSHINKPKKHPRRYLNVGDVTEAVANGEIATGNEKLSNGVIGSSPNGDETMWAENELYGKQLYPGELDHGGKTDGTESTMKEQYGWVENIIYE